MTLYSLLKFCVNEEGWYQVLKTLITIINETNPGVALKLERSLEKHIL